MLNWLQRRKRRIEEQRRVDMENRRRAYLQVTSQGRSQSPPVIDDTNVILDQTTGFAIGLATGMPGYGVGSIIGAALSDVNDSNNNQCAGPTTQPDQSTPTPDYCAPTPDSSPSSSPEDSSPSSSPDPSSSSSSYDSGSSSSYDSGSSSSDSGGSSSSGGWFKKDPHTEQIASDPVRLDWLREIQCGAGVVAPSQAMLNMYVSVQALLGSGNHKVVDSILGTLDVTKLPSEAMVGLLRYSFASKGNLPRWKQMYQRVADALRARGMEPERALRGLE